jgi:hypothetical protein
MCGHNATMKRNARPRKALHVRHEGVVVQVRVVLGLLRALDPVRKLRLLEGELTRTRSTECNTAEMVTRLDRLEEQANHLKIPVAYSSMLYELRNHIDLVREGLKKRADRAEE